MKRIMDRAFTVLGGMVLLLVWIVLTINLPYLGLPIAGMVLYQRLAGRKTNTVKLQLTPEPAPPPPAESFKQILARAKHGDVAAKYAVAERLNDGQEVKRDPKAALFWYLAAADGGSVPAQEKAAACYESGCAVAADPQKALAWYQRAACSGSATASQHVRRLQAMLANPPAPVSPALVQPYQRFYDLCESEPERILLEALIAQIPLKPADHELVGPLTVRPQAVILCYRADFLVNGHLVVEVDGKAYHNNENSFESDRYRDQDLIVSGYTPIRFPASQVYRDVDTVVARIVVAASRRPTPRTRGIFDTE
ncbi:MAG: DUF559 domain-containing protein [Candidatus Competibacter sp.]|nr:DUF559 domain-containing protein [Candidatus Competibacter sp.]